MVLPAHPKGSALAPRGPNRRAAMLWLACLAASAPWSGCYTDSAPLSHPTLTTPGAFIAVPIMAEAPGAAGAAGQGGAAGAEDLPSSTNTTGGGAASGATRYRLIRVVAVLETVNDQVIFHFLYGVVDSLEEAREATKLHGDGAPPAVVLTSLTRLVTLGSVVVGYRSLTEEEQDTIR